MNDLTHTKNTALQTQGKSSEKSPLEILLADTEKLKNVPIETVERLFALQERHDDRRAQIEFNVAMNHVQQEIEPVRRLGKNKSNNSTYARLEDISRSVDPVLVRNGFSRSMNTQESSKPDHFKAILVLRHVGGHSESFSLEVPIDDAGMSDKRNKTKIQGAVSSFSYAERVLLSRACGVQITDDQDGNRVNTAPEPKISTDQAIFVDDLLDESAVDRAEFFKYFQVDKTENLTEGHYPRVKHLLESRIAKNAERF